jgi:predicted GNAT family acetyltransferase
MHYRFPRMIAQELESQRQLAVNTFEHFLLPCGEVPQIGHEDEAFEQFDADGRKALYISAEGSYRFVRYTDDDTPISVLQLVSRDGQIAVISTVFTIRHERRRGHARRLLELARKFFHRVRHADRERRTAMGDAWTCGVEGERVWR